MFNDDDTVANHVKKSTAEGEGSVSAPISTPEEVRKLYEKYYESGAYDEYDEDEDEDEDEEPVPPQPLSPEGNVHQLGFKGQRADVVEVTAPIFRASQRGEIADILIVGHYSAGGLFTLSSSIPVAQFNWMLDKAKMWALQNHDLGPHGHEVEDDDDE